MRGQICGVQLQHEELEDTAIGAHALHDYGLLQDLGGILRKVDKKMMWRKSAHQGAQIPPFKTPMVSPQGS